MSTASVAQSTQTPAAATLTGKNKWVERLTSSRVVAGMTSALVMNILKESCLILTNNQHQALAQLAFSSLSPIAMMGALFPNAEERAQRQADSQTLLRERLASTPAELNGDERGRELWIRRETHGNWMDRYNALRSSRSDWAHKTVMLLGLIYAAYMTYFMYSDFSSTIQGRSLKISHQPLRLSAPIAAFGAAIAAWMTGYAAHQRPNWAKVAFMPLVAINVMMMMANQGLSMGDFARAAGNGALTETFRELV